MLGSFSALLVADVAAPEDGRTPVVAVGDRRRCRHRAAGRDTAILQAPRSGASARFGIRSLETSIMTAAWTSSTPSPWPDNSSRAAPRNLQLDVNGDGVVDERDVAAIAARAVKLEQGGRS